MSLLEKFSQILGTLNEEETKELERVFNPPKPVPIDVEAVWEQAREFVRRER